MRFQPSCCQVAAAKVGDKLTARMLSLGTTGFCAPEDHRMAVCLLPGAELSFADQVRQATTWPWKGLISYKTAIFRRVNKNNRCTHHDALEFPDGEIVLLTNSVAGQLATVLQLPAAPESVAGDQPSVEPDSADAIS